MASMDAGRKPLDVPCGTVEIKIVLPHVKIENEGVLCDCLYAALLEFLKATKQTKGGGTISVELGNTQVHN